MYQCRHESVLRRERPSRASLLGPVFSHDLLSFDSLMGYRFGKDLRIAYAWTSGYTFSRPAGSATD